MRNAIFVFLLIVLGAAAFIAYNAVFIVHQTQTALVLEFGNPKKVLTTPGLNFKIPFIQTVEFFDKRILDIDLPSKEVIAADQKRLVVDAFARYKIVDPLLFFQSVTNELGAHNRIDSILDAVMRSTLGGSDFFEVVKTKRADLMHDIAKRVDNEAKSFGIQVVDVRLRRVDLPEANSQAIYERMKTERQREAAEIRAQGTEASKRIRAMGIARSRSLPPTQTAMPSRSVVTATRSATASMPRPSAKIPNSLPSTDRCRPMRKA